MPLSGALADLKSGIEKAFNDCTEKSKEGGPENIIDALSSDIGKSIDSFIFEALVETEVLVDTIDTASAGPNAAPVPGKGVGEVTASEPDPMIEKIFEAYMKVNDKGAKSDASTPEINKELGKDISDAVLNFSKTVEVTNEVELEAFQSVGIPPITPAAIAKGETGTGKGVGGDSIGLTGLSGGPASKLAKGIEDAYNKSAEEGSKSDASPEKINKDLGELIGQSIHDFFVSSVVKTKVNTDGGTGELAPTSMMPVGTSMAPTAPPPMTTPGTGTGEGKIS